DEARQPGDPPPAAAGRRLFQGGALVPVSQFRLADRPAMNLDLTPLAWRLAGTPLAAWANDLQQQLDAKLAIGHGDLPRWRRAVDALPDIQPGSVELRDAFRLDANCDEETRAATHDALFGLSPWRKGPF